MKCFAICENPLINFLWKFAIPKNDLVFLAIIALCQHFIASSFLRLGLTPSQVNTCPRKFISFWANSLFALFEKQMFFFNLLQTSKCVICFFMVLEYTNMSSMYIMTNSSNFSWKTKFIKVLNIEGTFTTQKA